MPALVDATGTVVATHAFSTTRAGYRALLRWMTGFGQLQRVGVEQTGSDRAGVVRHLALAGVPVLEVTAADQAERRSRGKDNTLDAILAREPRSKASGSASPRAVTARSRRCGCAAARRPGDGGQEPPLSAAAAAHDDHRRAGRGPRPDPQPH
jgi:hypothetical protein